MYFICCTFGLYPRLHLVWGGFLWHYCFNLLSKNMAQITIKKIEKIKEDFESRLDKGMHMSDVIAALDLPLRPTSLDKFSPHDGVDIFYEFLMRELKK